MNKDNKGRLNQLKKKKYQELFSVKKQPLKKYQKYSILNSKYKQHHKKENTDNAEEYIVNFDKSILKRISQDNRTTIISEDVELNERLLVIAYKYR